MGFPGTATGGIGPSSPEFPSPPIPTIQVMTFLGNTLSVLATGGNGVLSYRVNAWRGSLTPAGGGVVPTGAALLPRKWTWIDDWQGQGEGPPLDIVATVIDADGRMGWQYLSLNVNPVTTLPVYASTVTPRSAAISSASWAGAVASFVTATPHGLDTNHIAIISGVSPSGYNATAVVTAAADSTHFTITLLQNPGAYVSGGQVQGGLDDVPNLLADIALCPDHHRYQFQPGLTFCEADFTTALILSARSDLIVDTNGSTLRATVGNTNTQFMNGKGIVEFLNCTDCQLLTNGGKILGTYGFGAIFEYGTVGQFSIVHGFKSNGSRRTYVNAAFSNTSGETIHQARYNYGGSYPNAVKPDGLVCHNCTNPDRSDRQGFVNSDGVTGSTKQAVFVNCSLANTRFSPFDCEPGDTNPTGTPGGIAVINTTGGSIGAGGFFNVGGGAEVPDLWCLDCTDNNAGTGISLTRPRRAYIGNYRNSQGFAGPNGFLDLSGPFHSVFVQSCVIPVTQTGRYPVVIEAGAAGSDQLRCNDCNFYDGSHHYAPAVVQNTGAAVDVVQAGNTI